MGLFKKKKSEPVEAYVPQAQPEPLPAMEPSLEENVQQVLQNQATLAQNQQAILNMIAALGQRIEQLAVTEDELPQGELLDLEEEDEEEFSDEEVREALELARAKKKGKKKGKA